MDVAVATTEQLSLGIIAYLERHAFVSGLRVSVQNPASKKDIQNWEQTNYPFLIPQDLTRFFQTVNGIAIRWAALVGSGDARSPLGILHINSLSKLLPINASRLRLSKALRLQLSLVDGDSDEEEDESGAISSQSPPKVAALFDLDALCPGGRVALAYRTREDLDPQVWHQDKSGTWFFVAPGFTEYYRLALLHLGIPHWQYAFTDVGLPPSTQQWMRLLCPERLALDLKNSLRPAHFAPGDKKCEKQRKRKTKKTLPRKNLDFEKLETTIKLKLSSQSAGGQGGRNASGGRTASQTNGKSHSSSRNNSRPSTALASSPSRNSRLSKALASKGTRRR